MAVIFVFALLFALLLIRVPVAFSIAISGSVGLFIVGGTSMMIGVLQTAPVSAVANYSLSAIPLFILMAQFIVASGVMDDLFDATRVWVGRVRGGAGVAATGAGAMFAAVSGSSTASAATLAKTSTNKMIEDGYDPKMSGGLVAVVGTLAAMIPPSIILVFYAVLAEQSVGKVLVAGFLPGVLVAVAIVGTMLILIARHPSLAPEGASYPWRKKIGSLKAVGPVLFLFGAVVGTVYFGVATPTESAALGALGGFILMVARGRMNLETVKHAFSETLQTSVMILMIIVGAKILGYFIAVTQVTADAVTWISSLDVAPIVIIIFLSLGYVVLGFFLDQIAILALTVPVTLPLITELGYDPIWFGIVIVLLAEIGLVTPPLGLNVFVVAHTTGQRAGDVFRGALPFTVSVAAVAALFIAFPEMALWLPNTMTEAASGN